MSLISQFLYTLPEPSPEVVIPLLIDHRLSSYRESSAVSKRLEKQRIAREHTEELIAQILEIEYSKISCWFNQILASGTKEVSLQYIRKLRPCHIHLAQRLEI